MLDLVSQMPLAVQARLLRVLQERSLQGAPPVCRIVATTQKDLGALVRAGTFRADLFYRLNVFPIALPALRERPEDLPGLAAQLVSEAAAELCVPPPRLTEAAIMTLQSERFPGNVRELKNLLGRALVRCRGPFLDAIHFGLSTPAHVAAETLVGTAYPCGLPLDLTALERLAIEEALRRVGGNRTHAARLLGIGLRTLRNKLRLWRETGLADSVEAEGSEHAA